MIFAIDQYADLNSPLHRWEPRCKLVGLGALVFAFAFVERWQSLPAMVGIASTLYVASRLPLSFLVHRLRYPSLLLLGMVAALPFLAGDTVVWQTGFITIRQEGCLAMLRISCRFFSMITLGIVLFGTAPFLVTVKTLRSLGLPGTLADMVLLSYRYLLELGEMLASMRLAMRLRGYGSKHSKTSGDRKRWFLPNLRDMRVLASLTGTLLVRSYEQSERVYCAMRLRGYGHDAAIASPTRADNEMCPWYLRFRQPDVVGLWVMLGIAVGLMVADMWGGVGG